MNGFIIAAISLVASAVGFYIAASFTLAQKQLLAATRFKAYLIHYGRLMSDWDAYKVTYLGAEWDKEQQAILQRGGSGKELADLASEKKKLWEQICEASTKPGVVPDEKYVEIAHDLNQYKGRESQWMMDALKVGRQNMLTGQTFLTDEEASHLGVYMATNIIALKMGIIELMDGVTYLVVRSVASDEPLDEKKFIQAFVKLLWRGVVVSRDYFKLNREVHRFTDSSILALTWRNISQGSRFRRR